MDTGNRLKVVGKLLLWLINGGAERMSNKAGYIGESNEIDVINANELSYKGNNVITSTIAYFKHLLSTL